jgi:hypothetical protein
VVLQSAGIVAGIIALALAAVALLLRQPLLFPPARFIPVVRSDTSGAEVDRLRAHVQMLAVTCHPRSHDEPQNLDRAAAYIREQLKSEGGRVVEQEYEWGSERYRNVIASFGPEDGPRVVVGAHYDTVEGSPGADDNASGVAGLIELGRRLGESPPRGRVDLVAFTLEEPPHFRSERMGSAHHAASLRAAGVAVRAMLSLETIGCFRDEEDSQSYPLGVLRALYPSRGNFVAVIGRLRDGGLTRAVKRAMLSASELPVESLNAPAVMAGVDFSDQLSYWAYGYPGLMVTDTAFYRNPRYHEPTDLPDTLDYARMGQVVQGVHAAVRALAAD